MARVCATAVSEGASRRYLLSGELPNVFMHGSGPLGKNWKLRLTLSFLSDANVDHGPTVLDLQCSAHR